MEYFADYQMGLLVVTCCLSSGCQFGSYYRQSPPNYLYKTRKSFELFFEVYKNLLMSAVIIIKRMEEFLEISDG